MKFLSFEFLRLVAQLSAFVRFFIYGNLGAAEFQILQNLCLLSQNRQNGSFSVPSLKNAGNAFMLRPRPVFFI